MMKKIVIVSTIQLMVVDCVQLPAQTQPSAVHVDLNQTGQPISKYIYGQFIKHLGRCIYGGLWAEMLEDRKFYYPVDGQAPAWTMYKPGMRSWDGEGHPYELVTRSPWMIIGDKKAVSMVTENPFVGEHTPRIALHGNGEPGGLFQERLGLMEGKEYTGRIVLAGAAEAAPIEVSLVWGGGAFSVFAWIKGPAAGQVALSQIGAANWLLADAEGKLMTELKGVGRFSGPLYTETVITDGQWHRIGLTWDDSNRTLYVDDVEVAKDTQSSLTGSDSGLYVGASKNRQPGSSWQGLIDDVRIYSRAIVP